MVMSYCQQDIGFLIANKSMTFPVVGYLAKKMNCIPVERPQDLAKKGTGQIRVKSDLVIVGVGTQFKKEITIGDTLKFD